MKKSNVKARSNTRGKAKEKTKKKKHNQQVYK